MSSTKKEFGCFSPMPFLNFSALVVSCLDIRASSIGTCYQTCFQSMNDFRILDEQ